MKQAVVERRPQRGSIAQSLLTDEVFIPSCLASAAQVSTTNEMLDRKTQPKDIKVWGGGGRIFLGRPALGVHMDLVTSEICQYKELSVNWLSANCLLIVC